MKGIDMKRTIGMITGALVLSLVTATVMAADKPGTDPKQATKESPWVNSLNMKFVPVKGTDALFCIWLTRVQDFESFVKTTGYDATEALWSFH